MLLSGTLLSGLLRVDSEGGSRVHETVLGKGGGEGGVSHGAHDVAERSAAAFFPDRVS